MSTEIDFDDEIQSMRESMISSVNAVQIEIAVCLMVYRKLEAWDKVAMKALRGVYASAGNVDCLSADSSAYQTVNRHMRRVAGYADVLTLAGLIQIADKGFLAVREFIESMGVETFEDLSVASGQQRQNKPKAPNTLRIKTDHMRVDVPPEASPKEIRQLAHDLLDLAKERAQAKRAAKQDGQVEKTQQISH